MFVCGEVDEALIEAELLTPADLDLRLEAVGIREAYRLVDEPGKVLSIAAEHLRQGDLDSYAFLGD